MIILFVVKKTLLNSGKMPLCYCFTSLKESKVPDGFECDLSDLVVTILGKRKEVTFFLNMCCERLI